jgi:hypothetical protein
MEIVVIAKLWDRVFVEAPKVVLRVYSRPEYVGGKQE